MDAAFQIGATYTKGNEVRKIVAGPNSLGRIAYQEPGREDVTWCNPDLFESWAKGATRTEAT